MNIQTIHISSISRVGLSSDIIQKYQNTSKCKEFIEKYDRVLFPPIVLYKGTNTIADGIHRICAQLYHGDLVFTYIEK